MHQMNRAMYPQSTPYGLQYTEHTRKMLKGAIPADALDYIAYDTLRFKAGAAVPTNTLRFFTIGVGQAAFVANAATEQYVKDYHDTNLQDGNRLPSGQTLIVDSIQANIVITDATDTTYPTSGPGTELPTVTDAVAAVAGGNLTNALLHQALITFNVGEKNYETGPLIQFPSDFGISGFSGFGIATNFEGVFNNGFGRCRTLKVQREIPPLINFSVDLRFLQALVISRQLEIQILLAGTLYRPVQ